MVRNFRLLRRCAPSHPNRSYPRQEKLLNRVKRIRGQVDSIERTLEEEAECSAVLNNIATCRGAMDALMAEVIEGHIRFHMLDSSRQPSDDRKQAADDLGGRPTRLSKVVNLDSLKAVNLDSRFHLKFSLLPVDQVFTAERCARSAATVTSISRANRANC